MSEGSSKAFDILSDCCSSSSMAKYQCGHKTLQKRYALMCGAGSCSSYGLQLILRHGQIINRSFANSTITVHASCGSKTSLKKISVVVNVISMMSELREVVDRLIVEISAGKGSNKIGEVAFELKWNVKGCNFFTRREGSC